MVRILIPIFIALLCSCKKSQTTSENTRPAKNIEGFSSTSKMSESQSGDKCTKKAAKALAKIWRLSLFEEADFKAFVSSNASFKRGADVDRCARSFGRKLFEQGIKNWNPNRMSELAGPLMQRHQIIVEQQQRNMQWMAFGAEIQWLAEVLNQGADGEFKKFDDQASHWRQQFRHALRMIKENPQLKNMFEQTKARFQAAGFEEFFVALALESNYYN